MGQGMYLTGAGTFGEREDAFGIATPLELLKAGDTYTFDIPLLAIQTDQGDHGGDHGVAIGEGGGHNGGGHNGGGGGHAGHAQMYYAQYPTDASITFDVSDLGQSTTYGLGLHGLTYEVRDNTPSDAGHRDELVIEWWPTPNTSSRHGGSVFTYSMTLTFPADEWEGVAPLDSIDLGRALSVSGYLADDEDRRIQIEGLTFFSVPTPGGFAALGLGVLAIARRRR